MKFIIGWVSYKKVNINEQTYIIYLCQRPRTVLLIHYCKGYQFHHTFSIGKCLHAFCFDTQRSTTRHVMSKFRLLTCSVSNWWRIADTYVIKQGEQLDAQDEARASSWRNNWRINDEVFDWQLFITTHRSIKPLHIKVLDKTGRL